MWRSQPAARRFLQAALLLDPRLQHADAGRPGFSGFLVMAALPVPPVAPPDAVVGHQFAQYALAQAAVGDAQPLRRPHRADRLQDGAAGQHQIGAVGADAGIGDALPENPSRAVFRSCGRRCRGPSTARRRGGGRSAPGRDGRRPASSPCPRCRAGGIAGWRARWLSRSRPSKACSMPATSSTIASKISRVTSRPPKRSASETTPTGSEVQETMWLASRGERWPETSISAISEEPPPMSNSTTPCVSRSTSEPQPDTASRASVWRSMISSFKPGLGLDAVEELGAVLGRAAGFGGDQPGLPDRAAAQACRRRSSAPRRRGPSPAARAGRWR